LQSLSWPTVGVGAGVMAIVFAGRGVGA